LKDLVVAEETSWKLYFCCAAQIAMSVQIQYVMRCMLEAYNEADDQGGNMSNIPYFSQSSFDIFCASMKDIVIPKGVYELVDIFLTKVIKIAEGYSNYTLSYPESFIYLWNDQYDLEDLQAMRALMKTNYGNYLTHAKKFGMGTSKWRDPVKPMITDTNDVDIIALLNHIHLKYYDNQPAHVEWIPNGGFTGSNLTDDYNLTEYFFKNSPNESPIHVLAPWFGTYDATNNKYGGLILEMVASAAEYYINVASVAQHGNNIAPKALASPVANAMLNLVKCMSDNEDAQFILQISGTNFTAVQQAADSWPLAVTENLLFGKNRGATETNDDLLNYFARLLV
jgi:hypothetical protein